MNLSCHICGQWCKDVLTGRNTIELTFPGLLSVFKRVQLNFHAEKHSITRQGLDLLKNDPHFCSKQIIFQMDGVNESIFSKATAAGVNAVPLFDLSHGAGVLPDEWPDPIADYCGYAGGLGPDNLQEQVLAIAQSSSENRIWIDMETRVRSDRDRKFDLDKVKQCLDIAKKYVYNLPS